MFRIFNADKTSVNIKIGVKKALEGCCVKKFYNKSIQQ